MAVYDQKPRLCGDRLAVGEHSKAVAGSSPPPRCVDDEGED